MKIFRVLIGLLAFLGVASASDKSAPMVWQEAKVQEFQNTLGWHPNIFLKDGGERVSVNVYILETEDRLIAIAQPLDWFAKPFPLPVAEKINYSRQGQECWVKLPNGKKHKFLIAQEREKTEREKRSSSR